MNPVNRRRHKRPGHVDFLILASTAAAAVFVFYRVKISLHYNWNWKIIPGYLFRQSPTGSGFIPAAITQGFLLTLKLGIWGIILGTVFGLTAGLFRVRKDLFSRTAGRLYVELIRNMPPIVIVFIFYYFFSSQILDRLGIEQAARSAAPAVKNILTVLFIKPELLDEFLSAAVSLALYEGAYIAEIFRSGINGIEKGQHEAAAALGLSGFQSMRLIILPQALKNIMPPLAGQFISAIKDSAIMSVISVPELSFQGLQVMASTYASFETWITITVLYFILTYGCARFLRYLTAENGLRKKRTSVFGGPS